MERDKAMAMLDQRCLRLNTSACTWPDVSQLFSEPGWEDAALQAERRALTEVKSRLDNMPSRWVCWAGKAKVPMQHATGAVPKGCQHACALQGCSSSWACSSKTMRSAADVLWATAAEQRTD